MKFKQLLTFKSRKKRKRLFALFLIISIIPFLPYNENSIINNVLSYQVKIDEAVDADSNIDATANIGDDGATSFSDAQTLNDVDQTIQEGDGPGYIAGSSVNELHDAITDNHAPTDLGTYSNDANMQADDGTMNTLTEEDTGGAPTSEYLAVNAFDDTYLDWTEGGATPYIDIVDGTNSVSKKAAGTSGWFDFPSTTKSGTLSVTCQVYMLQWDGDMNVEFEWTGDATAEENIQTTGAINQWVNIGTIPNLDSDTEINALRIRLVWAAAKNDWLEVDAMRVEVTDTGASNYEFDREFSFTGISPITNTIERLDINTGTIGTESLIVQMWDTGAWTTVVTIVDANDNVWVNTSLGTKLDNALEEFRFLGGTETTDTTLNTWEIDMVLIYTEGDETFDYELQWEHQSQNVDMDKDTYNITVFGFSSDAETFEIQTWDIQGSTWNTPLSLVIDTSEQWYNQSIEANAHDQGTSITWRYRGTSETADTTQTTLNIDYAGISAWNFTVLPLDIDNWGVDVVRPDDNYHSINITSVRFNVSAGVDYTLQISGTDGFGNPVTNNYVYWDTDSNPAGSTILTTSFVTLYSSLPAGDGIVNLVYVWFKVPFGTPDQIDPRLVVTLNVQIIKA